ncbi:WD domain, G-beta repeat containing protein [Entamoeba histolytica HM-1:IMSS-B]|uniref:WD domain containing protein n=5 Tax=Entamoeba histolytica TaxID=5759 RepID=B1N4G3_ENTH1|nr:WD domain containing protein [Entamoeba histolytica HM-1:IMSS]EMH76814.1 WD domain, G-beta repeat containing protein [Entamoeba histolytica HM-1:IMSS-B]EMS14405.1 protein tipD, putative [Entamoeba histolytica HM-3:IMSS]ENY60578.1 protein tipD, putative [Entamoeba histolytica HM-1:IMSS-A]GAT98341.1 WD domain containing protein [Entamoeba histolytica]EDS89143.1 WD domain containing protein [Entamoeba histolytica HM-1:IMSS]|eukprot:XP_001914079.1 WD domain containing protein [Entamoeba histolytica HM-1:IMSS]
MEFTKQINLKLNRRDAIQIIPWKNITSITISTTSKEEYEEEIKKLTLDLHNSTVFINAQTSRLFDAVNKIAQLENTTTQAEKFAKDSKEQLDLYIEKSKEEDNKTQQLEKQIDYLKNELGFSRTQLGEMNEKFKQVNYENHRLLDIIEDLRKQLERNSNSNYIQVSPLPAHSTLEEPEKHPSPVHNEVNTTPSNNKPSTQSKPKILQKGISSDVIDNKEHSKKSTGTSETKTCITNLVCHVPSIAVRNINGHTGDITAIAFNGSGQIYATGSEDRTVRIWDSTTSVCKTFLRGMSQSVTSIDFSEINDLLLVTSNDAAVRIFDLNRYSARYTLTGHSNRITGGKFVDAETIVTGSTDRTLRWWDMAHSRCKLSCPTGSAVSGLTLMRNQAVTSHIDGSIRFWDNRQKDPVGVVNVFEGIACSDVVFVDGAAEYLLTNGKDNTIWMVDPFMMRVVQKYFNDDYINPGSRIGVSADKSYMTVGSVDGAVYVWNLTTSKFACCVYPEVNVQQGGSYQSCYCSCWNPLSSQLISGYGRNVIVWDD